MENNSGNTPNKFWLKIKNFINKNSTFGVIAASILTAVLIIIFVFQSYQVDGPSMDPSLKNGDRLIVWKLSVTWSRITGHPYVPNVGDIVIFNAPTLGKQLVKRVVALPGDRVVVDNGKVRVFNNQHPNGYYPDTTLPYGSSTKIPYTFNQGIPIDEVMASNQIFVCGDNRPVSEDSRILGPISLNQLVGKLVLRIMPVNKATIY
jgi:signal peptidase I